MKWQHDKNFYVVRMKNIIFKSIDNGTLLEWLRALALVWKMTHYATYKIWDFWEII